MTEDNSRTWVEKFINLLEHAPKDRQKLSILFRDAAQRELIESDIVYMFDGVLKLQDLKARDAMIPRPQIVVIEQGMQLSEIIHIVMATGHSRFPVLEEHKDLAVGVLLAKDLLPYVTKHSPAFDVKTILRPLIIIPESKRLGNLLHDFQAKRQHLAVVVDEYGMMNGLITIEDILEQIVGDIDDEYDIDAEDFVIKKTSSSVYNIKAIATIKQFNEFFQSNLDELAAETVGGLLLHVLGRLPVRGELVNIGDFIFKILRADNRRIYLIEVTHTAAIDHEPHA
jgi:magnesium and cobalt transporter